MQRRLNIVLCCLLGAVCCATIISWARSYVSSEAVALSRRFERFTLIGAEGRIILVHGKLNFASAESWQMWRAALDPGVDPYKWSFAVLNEVSPVPNIEQSFGGFGMQRVEVEAM